MAGSGASMIGGIQQQTLQVSEALATVTQGMLQHKQALEEQRRDLLAALEDSHRDEIEAIIAAIDAAIAALEQSIASITESAENAKRIEARL